MAQVDADSDGNGGAPDVRILKVAGGRDVSLPPDSEPVEAAPAVRKTMLAALEEDRKTLQARLDRLNRLILFFDTHPGTEQLLQVFGDHIGLNINSAPQGQ